MSVNSGKRIRVVLLWIQILDKLDPFYKAHGEFFFTSRVTSGATTTVCRLPEKGHWEISDHPRFNKVDKIDKIIFEGEPGDTLTVEFEGEEIDTFSENDHLDPYTRVFEGDPGRWVARYAPGDEGSDDPENMTNWRIGYEIQLID
ncbi:MAG: hypothetical protein RQ745_02035 [Longimicrobiales bacterium]|nr:hypothetical protein [Longimicrobiales bacterium]